MFFSKALLYGGLIGKLAQSRRPRKASAGRAALGRYAEVLEDRTLLSITAGTDGDDAFGAEWEDWDSNSQLLAVEDAIPILWDGVEAYARPAEWIVRFEAVSGTPEEQVDQINERLATTDLSALGVADFGELELKAAAHLGLDGLVLIEGSAEAPFEDVQEWLLALGSVAYVEPNFIDLQQSSIFPDDPLFSSLYGLHNTGQTGGTSDADIDAPEAWDISTGSSNIVVAVVDTGVDYTHPDLAENIWINPGEIAGNGLDDDGNGYVDDVHGYDFYWNDGNPFDDHGHGTHVAGTIGAVGDNAQGVAGVNWAVQIMALKFLGPAGFGTTSAAIQAINYATKMKRDYGVNVVLTNNSWGGGAFSTGLRDAIAASGDQNMLFVAAAGNSGRNTDYYPAYPASYDLDNIISVAATDHRDNRAWFSNYGANSVDLGAPGVSVLSTVPRSGNLGSSSGYRRLSGTSMAAPHVAGAAALAWSVAPNASYEEIRDAIFAGVDSVASMAGRTVTGGRLNAFNALREFGLQVVSSSPADGEILTAPPLSFVIDLSAAYDPASVEAGDLLVNGIAAETVSFTDIDTLTFHYSISPVATQGLQTMTIAQDAIAPSGGAGSLRAFSASFRYDAIRMDVAATEPALGSTAQIPFTSLRVHLNEAYDPATAGVDDVVLSQGTVESITLIDSDTIEYGLSGITEEGTLTFQFAAGALTDLFGNPMLAFSGSVELDIGTIAYPTPLEPEPPDGSLIYDPIRAGVIGTIGDDDRFTIAIDPGQRLTVVLETSALLQGAVRLIDEEGVLLASGTAAAAGEDVVLQSVMTRARLGGTGPDPQTYTVIVEGAGETTGSYTVQLVLNASVEAELHDGTPNNTLATAQDLDGSFLPLLHAVDDGSEQDAHPERGAVLGRISGAETATTPGHLENLDGNSQNSWPFNIRRFNQPSMRYQQIYAASQFTTAGVIDEIRFRRDRSWGPFSTSGIDVQISLGYAATTVATASPTFAQNVGEGYVTVFDGLLTLSSTAGGNPRPFDIVIDIADVFEYDPSRGDLLLDIRMRNSPATTFFDASGFGQQNVTQRVYSFPGDVNAENGHVSAVPYGLVTQFEFATDIDWYRFTLEAGETATVALTEFSGEIQLELYDSTGALLAMGLPEATNVGDVLSTFTATAAGTYYAKVTGGPGTQYSLLVTRNAEFDTEGNDSVDSAQSLISPQAAGRRWVMGHIGEDLGSITLDAIDSGWWDSNGFHGPNNTNYVAGWGAGQSREFRNFFVFDLQSVEGLVTDAELRLFNPSGGYIGTDPSETFTVLDVSTPISELTAGGVGHTPVFDDLGSGVTYGAQEISRDDVDRLIAVPLNAAAVRDLTTQAGGKFAVAGAVTSLVKGTANELVFGYTGAHLTRQLALTLGDRSDFYEITAEKNATLKIETFTPARRVGEFVNSLDPMVRLYDSSGNLLAWDDNSAEDRLNAKLHYKALEAGTFYIEVISSDLTAEATRGEYMLSVEETTGKLPPFNVEAVDPPDGLLTRDVPTEVTVDLNDAVLLTTAAGADLTIDGLPAAGVGVVDGNTLTFDLPPYVFHWDANDGGNGHYYMPTAGVMTWAEAEARAAELGGHLVSINGQAEQNFIQQYFLSGQNQRSIYWIGMSDHVSEGQFVWSSGEPVTYTNWHPGEPNDFGAGEDFATINWHYGSGFGAQKGTWNDVGGHALFVGIIELNSQPAGTWLASDGVHQFSIAAGAMEDIQRTPLQAFTSQIELDLTPPRVIDISPTPGGVAAPGSLTVTVTFSEAMNAGNLDATDFRLQGLFRGAIYSSQSFGFSADGTVLTINYADLPDDRYTLTLLSGDGRFEDRLGWDLDGEPGALPSGDGLEGGDFTSTFALDPAGPLAYPTPFDPKSPLGSLIYDPEVDGTIAFLGDTDDFTLTLDAGQTIAVVVSPTSPGLQPSVEIRGPSGTLLGSASAAGAGEETILLVSAADAGTYTIAVGGASGTMGLYAVQTVLNAALESERYTGVSNNTRGEAQDLESSFIPLLKGADRGAVLGRSDETTMSTSTIGPDAFGYTATAVPFSFDDISASGQRVFFSPYWFRDDGYARLSSSQLSGFEFDFYGTTYTDLYVGTNGLITFESGERSPTNTDLQFAPYWATIAAFWDDLDLRRSGSEVYWQVKGSGDDQQLIVQWSNVPFYYYAYGGTITFQAILNESDGSIQLNYLDLNAGSWRDEGRSATVGIKDRGHRTGTDAHRLLVSYNSGPHQFVGTGKSTRIALPDAAPDFYSFSLDAGGTATIALTALGVADLNLEIQDGLGTTLAVGRELGTNVDTIISNFVASSSATYYVRVAGDIESDYTLVITREAVFDTESNGSQATAQTFAGLEVALGHVGGGQQTANTIRVAVHSPSYPYNAIYSDRIADQLNDDTFFNFDAVSVRSSGLDSIAELMNYDVVVLGSTYWYAIPDGMAAAVREWVEAGHGAVVGTGYVYYQLLYYSSASARADLDAVLPLDMAGYSWRPSTYFWTQVVDTSHAVTTGVSGSLGYWFGETSYRGADSGATVLALDSGIYPAVVVSETSGGRSVQLAPAYSFYRDLRVAGSAGDRLLEQAVAWAAPKQMDTGDIYSFTAAEGQTIDLFTTTPGDGPGEFRNTLDPHLKLYAPDGTLVATGVALADGRNEQIVYTVPTGAAGMYRVEVSAENGTSGEYILDPVAIVADPEPASAAPLPRPEVVPPRKNDASPGSTTADARAVALQDLIRAVFDMLPQHLDRANGPGAGRNVLDSPMSPPLLLSGLEDSDVVRVAERNELEFDTSNHRLEPDNERSFAWAPIQRSKPIRANRLDELFSAGDGLDQLLSAL